MTDPACECIHQDVLEFFINQHLDSCTTGEQFLWWNHLLSFLSDIKKSKKGSILYLTPLITLILMIITLTLNIFLIKRAQKINYILSSSICFMTEETTGSINIFTMKQPSIPPSTLARISSTSKNHAGVWSRTLIPNWLSSMPNEKRKDASKTDL